MPAPTDTSRRANRIGLARVAIAGVIWGTIPLVLRAADGASVIKVFYRVAFAAVALAIWMLSTGRFSEITSLPRRKLLQVAGQGVVLCVNWVLFLSALDMTNVATAELLGYTGPVFVAALAPFVTKERFDVRILLPLGFSLGGILVILAPQGIGVSGGRELLGAGLAFCSALTYATLLLRSKKILRGISGGALMVVEYTVASVILLPFVVALYLRGQGPTGVGSYMALATLGLVQTAFAGIIFLGGLRATRTDHAAILTYAEPVAAVLFAAAFLGEALTAWTAVGGAMVVAGGLLVARLSPASEPAPPLEAAGSEPEPLEAKSA
ncbi:MAG: DMT family transporter [Coriobacteriia bacterium]|nr:DMT family transporter [Coriobacteriia bacterium]